MYVPTRFKEKDAAAAFEIIDQAPFATLISVVEGQPFISHVPLVRILEKRGGAEGSSANADGPVRLLGHVARANPHSRLLASGDVTAVFHGPHAYISPTWYAEYDVPTWNYAVVHARGPVRLIESHEGILDVLRVLSDRFEAHRQNPWKFGVPEDLGAPGVLEKAIVGFEIEVCDWSAKFKLGQNRGDQDRAGVRAGLRAQGDDVSLALLRLTEAAERKRN